jgi:hypothetical protein
MAAQAGHARPNRINERSVRMRSAQKSSRARGRGGRKGSGSVVNRVFDSSGPEGKVRGTPQQIIDKYLTLARDAQTSGDRVMAENFLQHAEHYQRLLIQAAPQQDERRDQAAGEGEDDGASGEGRQDVARGGQGDGRSVEQTEAAASADQPANGGARAESGTVGGLTTIDTESSEAGEESLLVAVDESAPQTPRRRRGTRGNGASKQDADSDGQTGESA